MRSPKAAVAWGRNQVNSPTQDWTRLCLAFVRQAFGLPAVYPSARVARERAQHLHRTTDAGSIPAGVPVHMTTSSDADHIVLSIGGGRCLSTDARRRGRVDVVPIAGLAEAWGGQLIGWSEDLNGFRVWKAPAPANRVTAARADLRKARNYVRQAATHLEDVPETREIVSAVADTLDELVAAITRRLERMPKR